MSQFVIQIFHHVKDEMICTEYEILCKKIINNENVSVSTSKEREQHVVLVEISMLCLDMRHQANGGHYYVDEGSKFMYLCA